MLHCPSFSTLSPICSTATLVVSIFVFGILPGRCVAEPKLTASGEASGNSVLFSDLADDGLLFIDGEFIERPYQITATATSVLVNGVPFQVLAEESSVRDSGSERGDSRHGSDRVGKERSEVRRTPVRRARNLAELLQDDVFVIAFSDTRLIQFDVNVSKYAFCGAFLEGLTESSLQDVLTGVSDDNSRQRLTKWLYEFQPASSLQARLQAYVERVDAIEAEGLRKAAALVRLDNFAYPLTLAGMLLGVIALGHMLKWTAKSIVADQGNIVSPESVRGAELALLLMAGMSVVDLVWTILASQAGVMKEINPLAVGIIHSPLSLAVFKVTATMLGCGLLYALRKQRRGQEVTWWMCLVCVLVTFRWVMFDSMNA